LAESKDDLCLDAHVAEYELAESKDDLYLDFHVAEYELAGSVGLPTYRRTIN